MSELATPLSLRPQDEVECRLCEVHCDKVVYPSACMDRSCPFVYAYEEHGHTFMGCMQKVFEVEIDVDMVRAAAGSVPRSAFSKRCSGSSSPVRLLRSRPSRPGRGASRSRSRRSGP